MIVWCNIYYLILNLDRYFCCIFLLIASSSSFNYFLYSLAKFRWLKIVIAILTIEIVKITMDSSDNFIFQDYPLWFDFLWTEIYLNFKNFVLSINSWNITFTKTHVAWCIVNLIRGCLEARDISNHIIPKIDQKEFDTEYYHNKLPLAQSFSISVDNG